MRSCYKLIIISIVLVTYSCRNTEDVQYYNSGNLKSKINDSIGTYYYDSIDELIYKRIYRKPDYDSIVKYYKNGNIYESGKQDSEGRAFGNWSRFTKEGLLSETAEYFIVEGKSYFNRQWFFGRKGDTLWHASKFNRYEQDEFAADTTGARHSIMIPFIIYTKDTLKLNEPFLASVICNSPIGDEQNSEIMMLLAKEDYNFNDDFSNEREVKLDTFFNLKSDFENRESFTYSAEPSKKYPYIVAFGRYFKKPGNKILRGYMREFYSMDTTGGYSERRVYFEKRLFVKDSV